MPKGKKFKNVCCIYNQGYTYMCTYLHTYVCVGSTYVYICKAISAGGQLDISAKPVHISILELVYFSLLLLSLFFKYVVGGKSSFSAWFSVFIESVSRKCFIHQQKELLIPKAGVMPPSALVPRALPAKQDHRNDRLEGAWLLQKGHIQKEND